MYGLSDLKQSIVVTDKTVECPCTGCARSVPRMRRGQQLRDAQFFCPAHRIFISPSTFEYEDESSNLLWHDSVDRELLASIKKVKRECRLARDNSEDALTWNVFRYLEKTGSLSPFLSTALATSVENAKPAYWSYSAAINSACESLAKARREFGEAVQRSSEPDIVIEADGKMIWIEAKFGSTNETTPSDPENPRGYLTGGDGWFKKAFVSNFETVAITARRYELMRLWLLGSWIAANDGCDFFLLNIVREAAQETSFVSHIASLPHARFVCASWEQFYRWAEKQQAYESTDRVLDYMRHKSAGYAAGRLVPAFPQLQALQ